MKIRKIFAGMAAAALAASMMSVAASASTPIVSNAWGDIVSNSDATFSGVDFSTLTKVVFNIKNLDFNYGWNGGQVAANSKAGWVETTFGGGQQEKDVIIGDGETGKVEAAVDFGDGWFQLKAGYASENAWEIESIEF